MTHMSLRNRLLLLGACWASLFLSSCGTPQAQPPASREAFIGAAREIMREARYCALITLDASGRPRVRTMEPFQPGDDMVVWLATNRNTRKVEEIEKDPRVSLYYAAPGGDGYVAIQGRARLVDDPAEKARRWKEGWEEFYPERAATYLLIAVTPESMEVVSYRRNLVGDPDTWRPPEVRFP